MTVASESIFERTATATIVRLRDHPQFKRSLPVGPASTPIVTDRSIDTVLGCSTPGRRVPPFMLTGLIGIYAFILADLSLRILA
ncbi:MAG: hypothetical protein ACR2O1_14000 [Boseongicola sp.]